MSAATSDSAGASQGVLAETLLGVAASLSGSGNFDVLLANILQGAHEVMRCAACSVSLPDPATGDLLIHGTQRDWRREGRVFETCKPVNTADATQHPEHYKGTGAEAGLPTKALLTIPLMDGASCRGVMQAMNPRGRPQFNEEDMRIFIAFGSLVSVTLGRRQTEAEARVRAIEEAERRAELELARQVQARARRGVRAAAHPGFSRTGHRYRRRLLLLSRTATGPPSRWRRRCHGQGIVRRAGHGEAYDADRAGRRTLHAGIVHRMACPVKQCAL